MGLIKCSDCGKKVSDHAEVCPKCGCPVSISKEHADSKKTYNTDFRSTLINRYVSIRSAVSRITTWLKTQAKLRSSFFKRVINRRNIIIGFCVIVFVAVGICLFYAFRDCPTCSATGTVL